MASKQDDKPGLYDALDKAAEAILEKALASDSLPEAVKAFEIVSKFADNRAKASPPPPKKRKAKFDALKSKFHGERSSGPNGRGGAEADAGDEPAGNA